MSCKEEFIEILKTYITRDGADKLLDYLENKSDFFTCPASARYRRRVSGSMSISQPMQQLWVQREAMQENLG